MGMEKRERLIFAMEIVKGGYSTYLVVRREKINKINIFHEINITLFYAITLKNNAIFLRDSRTRICFKVHKNVRQFL